MLKQLKIENFTVFTEADFEFSPGLNVIVGENGTGKSHVLKLAYSVIAESRSQGKKSKPVVDVPTTKTLLGRDYAEKLLNVFRANSLDKLVKFKPNQHENLGFTCSLAFDEEKFDFWLEHRNFHDKGVVKTTIVPPAEWMAATLVFMPTRELLTIYPGFVSLYKGRYLEFEETYYDTCLLLGEPPLKKPMADLLSILEGAMGGKVELDKGRFYLVLPDNRKIEMPMVAEGIRKLAMLAQLVAVGALQKDGYLFWDEPEANLNPRLIKVVARVILQLAKAGIQVFIATHSLFLLRELEVLQAVEKKPVPQRYFALKQTADGVEVEQGNAIDDLQTLVLLDEELQQSDRYMALEQ